MSIIMKSLSLVLLLLLSLAIAEEQPQHQEDVHFGFHTENGYQRSEDITFKVNPNTEQQITEQPAGETTPKSVEYRGGYSFISADGYEYQVLYKANKNGFQPYVTAHKVKSAKEKA